MTPDELEKFYDKDGNERPPYRWELKERGYSTKQINEVLRSYSAEIISLVGLLMITLILGLIVASGLFLAFGVGISYNPNPSREGYIRLFSYPALSLLPVLLLVLANYFQNIFGTLLLMILVAMGLLGGGVGLKYLIVDSGDAWLYLPAFIYGILIIACVIKIWKK